MGGPSTPISASAAPGAPPMREPNTTAKLTMFGPGRNWQSENAALNSSAVTQRRSSTTMRRANGNTPPKPEIDATAKARKSSDRPGGCGAAGGPTASSFMREP